MDRYTLAYVHVDASRHLPVEKTIGPTESVSHVDSQESLEFHDWTTKSPSVGAKERRERAGVYHEARRRANIADRDSCRSRIDNSPTRYLALCSSLHPPFLLIFALSLDLSLPSAVRLVIFLCARVRRVCRRHPRGSPRAQPSLEVPRGQTSSQKLRYVGRSTAAHPGHPLTRETHASLLNQRRNHLPTHPRPRGYLPLLLRGRVRIRLSLPSRSRNAATNDSREIRFRDQFRESAVFEAFLLLTRALRRRRIVRRER